MRALATLLIVFPMSVLADDAPPTPPPARWSLGAGVATAVLFSTCSGTTSGPTACSTARGPAAVGSLERRLSDSNWLVLGMDGSINDFHQDSLPGGAGDTHWRSEQVTVDFGLRHVLTGRGAPVDVSLLTVLQGGYQEDRGRFAADQTAEQRRSSWMVGGNAGVALDRELAAGLGVRVATPIAGVWWYATRQRVSGSSVGARSVQASIYLEPRLELRLAF